MLYLITTIVLLVYLVLVWLLGRLACRCTASDVWILRGVLASAGDRGRRRSRYFYVNTKLQKAKAGVRGR